MALKLSPWLHPLSPSMIYTSTCVLFFLAIIIGNFGVSDADVALGRSHPSPNTSNNVSSGARSASSVSTSQTGSHLIRHQTSEPHRVMNAQLSGHQSRGTLTNSDSELLQTNSPLPSAEGEALQNQPYFPSPRRLQPATTSTLRSRQKRKALDGSQLDGLAPKNFETSYPLPVSLLEGSRAGWPADEDGSLDRLVIRALERSHGWAELSATLEKVDDELKKLLSLQSKHEKQPSDGTANGSLGNSTSVRDILKSAQYGESMTKSSIYTSSRGNQVEPHVVPTHNHLKDKFTYRRVRDLKHQRAIAAVVALEPCDLNANGHKPSDIDGPSVSSSPKEHTHFDDHVPRNALKKEYEHSGNHSIRHLHHHLNNLQYHHKSHHHHHKKQYRPRESKK